MNSKRIVGVILAVVIAGGIGVLANALTTNDSSSADAGTSKTSTPSAATDIVLAPGTAGPVRIGMTKAEAVDTGLFDVDVPPAADGCRVIDLAWKQPFAAALDVQTLENGTVVSVGVRGPGPVTADGLGVGSTLADVQAAYPGAKIVAAGFGQSGVLIADGDDWIGFLFNAEPGAVTADDQVSFVELTSGRAPSLIRDGC